MTPPDRYTQVPRTTLWLLPEDDVRVGLDEKAAAAAGAVDRSPSFVAEVRPFYVGKSVITNEEYEAFDPRHLRCEESAGDRDPVVNVSFRDAVAYCEWYARLSKKPFRLPTELEWEYACRGGADARPATAAEIAARAWHAGSAGGRAREIETLPANGQGLHDLLGNVWEWTSSLHRPYPIRRGDGREDLDERGRRVMRGGSFRTPVEELCCTARRAGEEDLRAPDVGFRIVRSL